MATLRVTTGKLAALALLALAAVWLVAPQGVPLYDGLDLPATPYRYVAPPPGWPQTPPPGEAVVRVPVVDPPKDFVAAADTPEVPQAQAQLRVPPQSLRPPRGAKEVIVSASPVAPDVAPPGLTIDGNVYRVAVSAFTAGDTTFVEPGEFAAGIALLGAAHNDTPGLDTDLGGRIFFRPGPGAPWEPMETDRIPGSHVYIVDVARAGDYAIAVPPRDDRSLVTRLIDVVTDGSVKDRAVLGGVLAGIVGVVVLLWRRRGDEEEPAPESGPEPGSKPEPESGPEHT